MPRPSSNLSDCRLFDAGWHPRDRHQGLRDLVEQLTGILFFAQRHREKLDDRGLTQLQGQVSRSGISRDLIVLDALSGADQGEIGSGILLSLPSLMTSSPSSTKPAIPLQGFARAGAPRIRRHSFSRSTWASVSARWISNSLAAGRARGLGHFGRAFRSCFSACRMSRS